MKIQIQLPLEPRRHLTPSENFEALSQRPEHQRGYLSRGFSAGGTQFNSYGEILDTSECHDTENQMLNSQPPVKYGLKDMKGGYN